MNAPPSRPSSPSVGVVIPTHSRPELLRRAVAAVVAQDYAGVIETVVVYDGTEPDPHLAAVVGAAPERPVRILRNTRTPGLAGTRNTGILDLDTDYIAFCDDDDHWLPEKITRQVERATRPDRPEMVTCSITVDYDGRRSDRLAGTETVTHADLTRSILAMLPRRPSSSTGQRWSSGSAWSTRSSRRASWRTGTSSCAPRAAARSPTSTVRSRSCSGVGHRCSRVGGSPRTRG
ncbi:glycosyltransferase family 2 protein [Nocardioides humi]|uniref:glycosyltransferase family 2 protein n=1 Tax=Nocardioides humi TaxID=449461 RepID=UPI001C6421B7|nr:glycosyltransferase family A protein [Nocardioides humi]